METTVTDTELAEGLLDILNRVERQGERFIVQRNGETIATITPAPGKTGTTWEELTARVGDLEFPGGGFADDLEAIQAAQDVLRFGMWEKDDGSS